MAPVVGRLVVDCSVVAKWKLGGEPHHAEADELFLDWQHAAVELYAPNTLPSEVVSAFLRAHRRGRITEAEAADFVRNLLALPFVLHETTTPLGLRAFEIAKRHNQRSYDCLYVALAEREGIELWTGDQRLYNSLQAHFPFIRWIADYRRKRP